MPKRSDNVCIVAMPGVGTVCFSVQPAFLTISEEFVTTYYFDGDGRFLGGVLNGLTYKRGLDSRILVRYFAADRSKVRRSLGADERRHLLADVRRRVERVRAALPLTADVPMRGTIEPWLDRILTWDVARLEAEQPRFAATYKPVSILPPDQYMAVVVQVTEGCSWNQCTFCSFYQDRPFRVKAAGECREHAQQIKELLGASIALRKSVFLADANALIIPQPRLVELLQVIHEVFPVKITEDDDRAGLDGIYAFLDIFGAERKSLDNYRELREYGLRRIYIGLETGDAALFGLLNKPGSPAECIDAVQTIKAAGLQVGIIVLAGAGGEQMGPQHVEQSVAAIKAMGLDAGDIVYLSPLVLSGDDPYTTRMRELGIRELQPAEVTAQVDTVKGALRQMGANRPKVTLYQIEDFIY